MGFWNLLADADAIELLIRIGIVVLFMLGPYLLQLLGGKAVQDDRGNAEKRRKREPQSELEKEIADFLEQSRRGGNAPQRPQQQSDYVEAEDADDFIPADVAPERSYGRDKPGQQPTPPVPPDLVEPATDTQTGKAMANSLEEQPYLDESQSGDLGAATYQYEEAETFSYDPVASRAGEGAASPSIAEMLRNPAHVRNAFVLGEILARPNFGRRR